MNVKTADLNTIWATLLIEELIRNGVTQFCIAPGSRSTPLVAAVARHAQARTVVHFDERGLAFYALGYARATNRPAAVITTSGTAVANLLPAVVEASMDAVPMILLTADRPPELRETSANQTIRQPGIFSHYTRWAFDLPCPDAAIDPALVLTTVDQACYRARRTPAGPVHLNCMFREPLITDTQATAHQISLERPSLQRWGMNKLPFTNYRSASSAAHNYAVTEAAEIIADAKRPALVIGELRTNEEREAVLALSRKLEWPTFADITSGIKLGNREEYFIGGYDFILSEPAFASKYCPDTCLWIGGRVTSARLTNWLVKANPRNHVMVSSRPWRHDQHSRVTLHIETDLALFCRSLPSVAKSVKAIDWHINWPHISRLAKDVIDSCFESDLLTEEHATRIISRMVPVSGALFLASSLPVRFMNNFCVQDGASVPVQCNRGASGIDGTIASAAGYAAGLEKAVTLLIGDQAFLHDLNSLALLRSAQHPVTIVVLNNEGGRIFEHLPISRHQDLLISYFVMSHELEFARSAEQFGLSYHRPRTAEELQSIYSKLASSGDSAIIEVHIHRLQRQNVQQRLELAVAAMVKKAFLS
ncbi:MAG: 2-succinyl-5-enolpyruvyl-6-hydroxy-3-cyclohexene-1-carboxylic-acid synthase [Candidatus Zixiibacteriota bacterium]